MIWAAKLQKKSHIRCRFIFFKYLAVIITVCVIGMYLFFRTFASKTRQIHSQMKRQYWCIALIAATLLTTGCRNSHRDEIDQRREALKQKQDSSLQAAQQELAIVDSTLEVVKAEYERRKAEVDEHKAALQATEQELTDLTLLRMKRDSLKVQWDLLGAKIKYIRQKQKEIAK